MSFLSFNQAATIFGNISYSNDIKGYYEEEVYMKKKLKTVSAVFLGCLLLMNSTVGIKASTGKADTYGYLGPNSVTYSIINESNSYYSKCKMTNKSVHRVETIGIKNINVVNSSGGGAMNLSRTAYDSFEVSYNGNVYGSPIKITGASGTFYVNSYNFGSFTRNLAK